MNYEILTKIASLIETHHGTDAKKNFVLMVKEIKKMSATDFLNELYTLQVNNWKFQKQIHTSGIDVGDHEKSLNPAISTIFEGLAGSTDRDESSVIRDRFLKDNGIEIKEERRDIFGSGRRGCYYDDREW